MYNEIILTKLKICLEHLNAIETYFRNCSNAEEFFTINNGAQYDASLMRLQALGENLKKISEKHPEVIKDLAYPQITDVIKLRDYISHHYEKLEHEIIYDTCKYSIPEIKTYIEKLISVNQNN